MQYFEIENLNKVYLEDSHLLDVKMHNECIVFKIDFVLKSKNKFYYSPPREGEMYSYKEGELVFKDVKKYNWISNNLLNAKCEDMDGKVSFGNIDELKIENNHAYINGSFGELEIYYESIKINYYESNN